MVYWRAVGGDEATPLIGADEWRAQMTQTKWLAQTMRLLCVFGLDFPFYPMPRAEILNKHKQVLESSTSAETARSRLQSRL